MLKLLFTVLIAGLLASVQSMGFSLLNVKPNLALLAVIAASFFIDNLFESLLLVALSAIILKFSPVFENEIIAISLIGAFLVIIQKYLPWRHFVGNLALITLGTFLFYAILAPNLIISTIFLKEIIINLALGMLVFALFSALWQNKGI